MPPRRQLAQQQPQQRVEEVYERDDLRRIEQRFEQLIEQLIDQRMDILMDRLTDRMGELLVNQNRKNPNHRRIPNFDECRNPFVGGHNDDNEYIDDYDDVPRRHRR